MHTYLGFDGIVRTMDGLPTQAGSFLLRLQCPLLLLQMHSTPSEHALTSAPQISEVEFTSALLEISVLPVPEITG